MTELKLWEHQQQAVLRAKQHKSFGLFFEQGCGKTLTLIKILEDVFNREQCILPTLIFCPVSVGTMWERELHRFLPIPKDQIFNACGVRYAKADALKKRLAVNRSQVVVCNYEVASSLQFADYLVKTWQPQVLICDESHKVKNPRAARTKFIHKLAKNAKYRYIATGTPITQDLMDLWSQVYILDQGERLGKAFWDFRRIFFTDRNAHMPKIHYFPDWQPKSEKTPQHMAQLIDDITMTVKKDECMDLPPLVKQQLYVRLHQRAQESYNSIERDAVAYTEDGIMSADLAITKLLRMQQVCGGFLKLDSGELVTAAPVNAKIQALAEIMDAIPADDKMIVWCNFVEELRAIKRLLLEHNIPCVELHGGVDTVTRQKNIDLFQDPNNDIRIMLANPQAGGIGINLTQAKYAIFFSRGFSLEVDQQAEARNYRGGSEIHDKIIRVDIIAQGTVDEVVYQALADKKAVADSVMDYWRGKLKRKTEKKND